MSNNAIIYLWQFNGGPTSGTLSSISMYLKVGSSGTINAQMAVYGVTSGNLIGNTSAFAVSNTAFSWFTQSATGTLNDANGNYWIAIIPDGTTPSLQLGFATSGGNGEYTKSPETYGTWPSTITSPSTTNASRLGAAYFTYTSGGGGPVTTGNMFAVF
jgi:hypothetical protein